jgi:hypothetical protein
MTNCIRKRCLAPKLKLSLMEFGLRHVSPELPKQSVPVGRPPIYKQSVPVGRPPIYPPIYELEKLILGLFAHTLKANRYDI